MHGSIDPRVLLRNELAQRTESGFDTAKVVEQISEQGGLDTLDDATAQQLYDVLEQLERRSDWRYVEPDDLDGIRAECDWTAQPVAVEFDGSYETAVLRAWTGRIAGNMLGKPVEGFSRDDIRSHLEQVEAWPLTDYFPAPGTGEESNTPYIPCWTDTTRGRIDGSSRDDDVDYTILNLHVLCSFGPDFSTDQVAATWLELLPYLQTYTAERVAIRNLIRGDPPTRAALARNPYREFIGAAIRADVFGYVLPGDPGRAAELAYRDATLSHCANGIYSEMWCAALIAAAFAASDALAAIEESLRVVPRRSRLYEAVDDVRRRYLGGDTWDDVRDSIESRWGQYSWVHAVNNAAVVAAGVLYGAGDFGRTIGLTVVAGLDTDSNGGTAGSVGALLAGGVDARWAEPLHDLVRSAVFGYDNSTISALSERTVEVARGFRSTDPAPTAPRDAISRDLW